MTEGGNCMMMFFLHLIPERMVSSQLKVSDVLVSYSSTPYTSLITSIRDASQKSITGDACCFLNIR